MEGAMMNQRHLQRFVRRAELGGPVPSDTFRQRLFWLTVALIVLNLVMPAVTPCLRVAMP